MKKQFGKKGKQLTAVIILAALCTACGKEKAGQLPENVVETEKPDKESVADKEDTAQPEFQVVRQLYLYSDEWNDIYVYYPQLTGFEDAEKQERINTLIEMDAKEMIGEKNKEGDYAVYHLDLNCEVEFVNERIISVLYKGVRVNFMPKDARMTPKAMASTIDMEEEKVITLKDVVTDFSELSDMLLRDEFENITMWGGSTEGFEASVVVYESDLETDLQARHQWYLDEENFIVIIPNTLRADYNAYSISIESVRHILDETFLKSIEK